MHFVFLTQISVGPNIFELTQINIIQINVLQISITQTNVPPVYHLYSIIEHKAPR